MTFTYWDMALSNLLMFSVGATFSLFGVFLGGLFVLRAKGNGYEPIIPPLREKDTGATNLDDFDTPETIEVNFDEAIEKIFKQREAEEDKTNPAMSANDRMKGQM